MARENDREPGQSRAIGFFGLKPGAEFAGRYRIIHRAGSGGMGEVYKAHDRVADHVVALKILLPRPDQEYSLERLRRELRNVRALKHPGVLGVHEIAEFNGLHYLVMEYLEGEPLSEFMQRQGVVKPDEAARILAGILEALAAAHAARYRPS